MDQRNWPVPHNVALAKPLEVGQVVAIRGTIFAVDTTQEGTNHAFTVNLATSGQGYDAPTIAFHISVRLTHKEVVFNTKENGTWGTEEKAKLKWKPGSQFDLRVRVNENHFEVLADGKAYATYQHRLAIQQVTHLFIDGPISLEGVNWGGKYYPMPYETGLSKGFGRGQKMYISGEVHAKPERFHVNLITSKGDKALHFNPRFGKNEVVRNTQVNGEWQTEETDGGFPFEKSTVFDLIIKNNSDGFEIIINNNTFSTYKHRVQDTIETLEVGGDIELHSIQVQ